MKNIKFILLLTMCLQMPFIFTSEESQITTKQSHQEIKGLPLIPTWLNKFDKSGKILLHNVVMQNNKNAVNEMIHSGVDLNALSNDVVGGTALTYAASFADFELLKILIDAGADLEIGERFTQRTALYNAVNMNRKEAAHTLIHAGACVSCQDHNQYTPLHVAARAGNKEIVKLLIDSNADLNLKDCGGNTPLHAAILYPHCVSQDVIKILVAAGADVNIQNDKGQTSEQLLKALPHSSRCCATL